MVVSTAFEEFTEILKRLESSDVEIGDVAIREQRLDQDDEMTADLSIEIPVFENSEQDSGISLSARDLTVADEQINVALSVSLPVDSDDSQFDRASSETGLAGQLSQSNATPIYKDPEALEAVYEEYDTFPKMTEALGADVTSETVRRYMVEYEIHEPSDNTPQSYSPTSNDERESSTQSESDPRATTESVARSAERDSTSKEPTNSAGSNSPELGQQSVAELIEEESNRTREDAIVADGLGVPRDLCVAEFADVINSSNTIREVSRQLEMSPDDARQLLKKLDLTDLVTDRLTADQINVSHAEIHRRIAPDTT